MVFLRNDYRRGLRNGSLGEIASVDRDDVVTAIFDGVEHPFVGREVEELDHAYAITVHKAQGSGFDAVVVPVVASRLLDRSLVYTAVTRGIERVVLIGDGGALRRAVSRPPFVGHRETGLIATMTRMPSPAL